jgi:hypothetical protein
MKHSGNYHHSNSFSWSSKNQSEWAGIVLVLPWKCVTLVKVKDFSKAYLSIPTICLVLLTLWPVT